LQLLLPRLSFGCFWKKRDFCVLTFKPLDDGFGTGSKLFLKGRRLGCLVLNEEGGDARKRSLKLALAKRLASYWKVSSQFAL